MTSSQLLRDSRPLTDDDVARRRRDLTDREVRLFTLASSGGLSHEDLAATLGVTKANVGRMLQRVRRKLAVPRHQDLATFAAAHPELTRQPADEHSCRRRAHERRDLHLLRATIDDMKAVGIRARHRIEELQTSEAGDPSRRLEELATIERVAAIAEQALADAIAIARQPAH